MIKEKINDIKILFQQMQPELIHKNLLDSFSSVSKGDEKRIDSEIIGEVLYRQHAHGVNEMRFLTEDEIMQRFYRLNDDLSKKPRGGIFSLLCECANELLYFQGNEPLCRLEGMLKWRDITLAVGQDLFTCAGLAARDVHNYCESLTFQWPTVINTDSTRLQHMLEQGMAENHFHLNGSTQIFPLTWAFLMNHPICIKRYFDSESFGEDMSPRLSHGFQNNRMSWTERIYLAAWIRATLFKILQGCKKELGVRKEYLEFATKRSTRYNELRSKVEGLRLAYGARLPQRNGKRVCIDYAITPRVLGDDSNNTMFRLLAGERSFLYLCFAQCFRGDFSKEEKDLFYLYLCIKSHFRSELIQNNGRRGFRAFSDYQDRKNLVWGDYPEYWEESYRLSIGAFLAELYPEKRGLRSLEMRIMPREEAHRLKMAIWDIDQNSEFLFEQHYLREEKRKGDTYSWKRLMENVEENANYFYVLHFAKSPDIRTHAGKKESSAARNATVRKKVKKQSRAIARALGKSSYLCSRIRGIDACSHEIGCRPETFATAFRYLRTFYPKCALNTHNLRYWPRIAATYHVGEDFLDISDGLRAIDEAVCFLNLTRGDRIGHALALGINCEQYYRIKGKTIALPAQDLLDNLVWLLFRSMEFGIIIPNQLSVNMKDLAEKLLRSIYGDYYTDIDGSKYAFNLRDYYDSWKLRGDAPELYTEMNLRNGAKAFVTVLNNEYRNHFSDYRRAMLDEHQWEYTRLEEFDGMRGWLYESHVEGGDPRANRVIQLLLKHYHFGLEERYNGEKIEVFKVEQDYIALMKNVQDKMMERLMGKGIYIECNPSSNRLIGTFDKYEQHPAFRFNQYSLPTEVYPLQKHQMAISVNTDDQGIFDTSLENEYGLLWACLQLRKDAEGRPIIDDDSIYSYLNHLREMSIDMTFPKSIKVRQQKYHKKI